MRKKNLSTKEKLHIKEVADRLNVTILSVRNYIEKDYLKPLSW
jgi:DNA-binding CsgD family transcriptional regulator